MVFYQNLAKDPLSADFLLRAEAARASIPDPVWQGLQRAGWRVKLVEFVTDAVPHLRHTRPRGWPLPYTWNHTDALSLPASRTLVLAEKRLRPNGEIIYSERVAGVFRHELGHAFDLMAGRPFGLRSATPDFAAAYRRDVAGMAGSLRRSVAYYLQPKPAGPQEAFAEAFAIALGGGSDVTKRQDIVDAFPEVLAFVKQDIERCGRP